MVYNIYIYDVIMYMYISGKLVFFIINFTQFMAYSWRAQVLLWSNAVIYGFDPISRLMTACTSFRCHGSQSWLIIIIYTWV